MFMDFGTSSATKTKAASIMYRRILEGTFYQPVIDLVYKALQEDVEMTHNAIIRKYRKEVKKGRSI